MWNLKNKINEQTKLKQTHRYREETDGCQREGLLKDWLEKGRNLEAQIGRYKIVLKR